MTVRTFLDGKVTLHPGDCRDALRALPDCSIDSVVTDPPYALVSIVKRFGGKNATPAKDGDVYARSSAGFMGKQWDTGETAFAMEFWTEVLRVLKPGGHLVAFSGTRTYHRMACAIEDAGFEIRDQIGWAYGSGFPKSHDVSKGIDKAAGAEREIAGVKPGHQQFANRKTRGHLQTENLNEGWQRPWKDGESAGRYHMATAPATEAAKQWQGWGTALKPAWEPICLARKPLSGTVAENVLTHGTGALNIDGCRVETVENLNGGAYALCGGREAMPGDERSGSALGMFQAGKTAGREFEQPPGRWPANLLHDGSDQVLACFPSEAGAFAPVRGSEASVPVKGDVVYGFRNRVGSIHHADSGSAARFFACFPQQNEARCDLCNLLLEPQNDTVHECDANSAAAHSPTLNTQTDASALSSAAGSSPRAKEGKSRKRSTDVPVAAAPSSPSCPTSGNTARKPAPMPDVSRIAQNAMSAASLCASCATAIAQSLVATQLGQSPEAALSQVSISEHSRRTLSRSLALHVAGRESTDITTTTESLKTLLGCVLPAIAAITNSERSEGAASTNSDRRRLHYTSKADADDRLGSKHPTVKPLDLMQWLVRLVTPKGGTCLDPFAGTGTTGEAAWREGCRAILIEREEEYQADIARRMELAANPTKRAAVAATKNKLEDPNTLPLFSTVKAAE